MSTVVGFYADAKHVVTFRNLKQPRRGLTRSTSASFVFVSLNFIAATLAGCAAPGQPITRRPPAPTPVSDLSARQIGNSVSVTFTLPKQTVQGRPLTAAPQVDIYRQFVPASAAAERTSLAAPSQQIVTIPSQTLQQYRAGEPYSFSDVLSAAELSAHAGSEAVYMVRTRTANHDSANSNLVAIPIFPAPQPVTNLQGQVTRSAIILSWTPAETPEAAATLGPVSLRYRIYRSSKTSAAPSTSPMNDVGKRASVSAASIPFEQIAELSEPPYRDSNFTFGQTYAYHVVTVAQYGASAVESEASPTVEVTPRDTFPPPAPTGLVAAVAPATASTPAHVNLSWNISTEPNVAGYNIYRSTADTVSVDRWDRLTSSPLLTPAFRDIPEVSGKQYFYRVTVVDTFGNESAPSVSVNVSLPAPSE
ncbi:MAG TPA: fibronectin type III domain-containing protein [Candidatus Acidoferrales bacterium]|nr:fibronectin type III domain-containing protein [Candidatus Acidoferrales bacterium]